MVIKVFLQILIFLASTMLLLSFGIRLYERWSTSKGPLVAATVLRKYDYVPKKSAVRIYNVRLSFKPHSADFIITDTEISRAAYLSLQSKRLVTIHYNTSYPKQVVLASDGWFQWRSIGVLALGLVLLYACFTIKEGKQKQIM